jgi:hypothetical protein
MSASKTTGIGLPSTGAVLGFMVDCLGVSKEDAGYKDLELLRKGGMSPEKDGVVMMKAMRAIIASFMDSAVANGKLEKVLKESVTAPVRRIRWQVFKNLLIPVPEFGGSPEAMLWRWDADGRLEDVDEHLVHDWTEFICRHNSLVNDCGGANPPSERAVRAWAVLFVVPFIAANLVEYQANNSQIEKGMPSGRFWYLPIALSRDEKGDFEYKWPVNQVLEWWEDLLGSELYEHAGMLCELGNDPDIARREIHAWRCENRPPKPTTIERWCKMNWADKYKGVFIDDSSLPLVERWHRCRELLFNKGMADNSKNWLEAGGHHGKKVLGGQYRGEPLEQEILPFKGIPFAAFFDSPDAVAAGLPVEELIRRVAERYAPPTNAQVKARLLLAAATQRAFTRIHKALGNNRAFYLLGLFQELYCFLTDLHNKAESRTTAEILRLLQNLPEDQMRMRCICEWLYLEESWRTLPSEISALVRHDAKPL